MLIKSTSAEFLLMFILGFFLSRIYPIERDYVGRDLLLLDGFRKSQKFVSIINLYSVN